MRYRDPTKIALSAAVFFPGRCFPVCCYPARAIVRARALFPQVFQALSPELFRALARSGEGVPAAVYQIDGGDTYLHSRAPGEPISQAVAGAVPVAAEFVAVAVQEADSLAVLENRCRLAMGSDSLESAE